MPDDSSSSCSSAESVASRVRNAFASAYAAYEAHAFGADELRPRSNTTSDKWGGLAVTMVDALDTMVLMDLHEPYERSKAWLLEHLPRRVSSGGNVAFFEITIRVLGGLLSVYTLNSDHAVLGLAAQMGRALEPAFADSPTGIPLCTVDLGAARASCPETDLGLSIPLAELGSVQLEFAALGDAVGEPRFARVADGAFAALRRLPALDGLYPLRIRPHSAGPASKEVSFGSGSDSFYETLLKRWLQGGKADAALLRMYRQSLVGLRKLLRRSHPSGLLFVARANFGEIGGARHLVAHRLRARHTFEHLTCFLPGMLALGAHHGAGLNATWEWEVADELLATCEALYDAQPSGLGPERVEFHTDASVRAAAREARERGRPVVTPSGDFDVVDGRWPLRPEYVESLYVMWRLESMAMEAATPSSDEAQQQQQQQQQQQRQRRLDRYRQRGAKVVDAIEAHCRTDGGAYAGLRSVQLGRRLPAQEDLLESFFFAETLKYLYLLFSASPRAAIDLDAHLFTTEAHLVRVLRSNPSAHHHHDRQEPGRSNIDASAAEEVKSTLPPWWRPSEDGVLLDEESVPAE